MAEHVCGSKYNEATRATLALQADEILRQANETMLTEIMNGVYPSTSSCLLGDLIKRHKLD